MRATKTKRLVIDADVARASGGEEATNLRAIDCRDFLEGVRKHNHKMVTTRKISDEWKRHQSRFALAWRTSMEARRRVVRINPPEYNELQDKVTNTTDNENDIDTMQKDMLLLEAALETDKTVISLDETVRRLFARASQQVGEIRDIIWVNPERAAQEQPIEWLKNGTPSEIHRQLSAYPT